MKKIYLSLLSLALINFAPSALAQQQINNDGASVDELQPQSQNIQNNAGSERYSAENINNNVGNSDVLKNTKVPELSVTGAPASTNTTQPKRGIASWLILASGILIVLMAPALLYVRDLNRRSGAMANKSANLNDNAELIIEDPPQVIDEPKKSKKKSKNKSANKARRGKKKK